MARFVGNVLKVANPFQIAIPPKWWLNELHLFDDRLVVFPSQTRATMVLARKAVRTKGESPHDAKGVAQNPDTLIMASHRLVRVCEILPGCLWDQRIFQKLAAHDIQRLGGPKVVADRLDAMDERRRANIEKAQEDELHNRSVDAYKSYKHRIGETVSLANRHGRGTVKKKPISVHVRKSTPPPAQGSIVLATT